MAEEGESEETAVEGETEEKGGKKKLILFGAIGLVVLLVLAGGAAFMFGLFSSPPPVTADGEMPIEAEPEPEPAFYLDLPEMLVNLNTQGRSQFIRLQISLEVSEDSMIAEVEADLPRVLDAFQMYLRELRPADLGGSAGLVRLKQELRRRINMAVYPARIQDVLFKELLIQ